MSTLFLALAILLAGVSLVTLVAGIACWIKHPDNWEPDDRIVLNLIFGLLLTSLICIWWVLR